MGVKTACHKSAASSVTPQPSAHRGMTNKARTPKGRESSRRRRGAFLRTSSCAVMPSSACAVTAAADALSCSSSMGLSMAPLTNTPAPVAAQITPTAAFFFQCFFSTAVTPVSVPPCAHRRQSLRSWRRRGSRPPPGRGHRQWWCRRANKRHPSTHRCAAAIAGQVRRYL